MRAKFNCEKVINYEGCEEVSLHAVQSDEKLENQHFNTATPAGTVSMMIDNPRAHGFFAPGKSYYLDFIPVEE